MLFELTGEMGGLLETEVGGDGFYAGGFFEEMARGDEALFVQPFLRATSEGFLGVASQLAGTDPAKLGEGHGVESGLVGHGKPMMEMI
jgi:hypothetical protein